MNPGEAQPSRRAGISAQRASRYARILQETTLLVEHIRTAMSENGLRYTARTLDEALDALQEAQEALAKTRESTAEPPERGA